MRRTGIFLHYQEGERLRDFPQALDGILDRDNVFLYDALYPLKPPSPFDLEPIPLEFIHRVHERGMVERVRQSGAFDGALFSAAGTVAAAVRIWRGDIDNAFCFTGYGDHHAGSHFFGGGCYLNGAAIAIRELQASFQARRFAIVDTDAHHGDGTWELFEKDPDVLDVCLCSAGAYEGHNNVNVTVPWRTDDERYLALVKEQVVPRVRAFAPEAVFWNWGYDGTAGEYGDMGLTPDVHARIAAELKGVAEEVCRGRLIVVLCGGSRRDMARRLIPQVIRVLAGL
ncbi:MAG: hypothetical protein SV910_06070 [Chloroflexota bacterium]|nr:hypothetical protein [Chloroflexota bacterium]